MYVSNLSQTFCCKPRAEKLNFCGGRSVRLAKRTIPEGTGPEEALRILQERSAEKMAKKTPNTVGNNWLMALVEKVKGLFAKSEKPAKTKTKTPAKVSTGEMGDLASAVEQAPLMEPASKPKL